MNAPTTHAPNALALLSELTRRGVELRANGDRLAYDAPAGAIGDLLPAIQRFKPQLLELLAPQPPAAPDEQRKAALLSGQTVVANKDIDGDFIEWAEQRGLAIGIMRGGVYGNKRWGSKWGNPFKIGPSGDRDAVCDKHAAKLDKSPELLAQIGELSGKVLVCCCYPLRCHGDELARRANELPAVATVALEWTPDTAATAILDAAYFNQADGGIWCIGWQQPSRAAWQWAAIENGGTLDETTGLPSMTAADAITWAKTQKENKSI